MNFQMERKSRENKKQKGTFGDIKHIDLNSKKQEMCNTTTSLYSSTIAVLDLLLEVLENNNNTTKINEQVGLFYTNGDAEIRTNGGANNCWDKV